MTRIFTGWDRPALALAAEVLCHHYADEDRIRLDRAVVALPGGRAGRRLKEILVEEARSRGLRLVPPRIVTVGALPELLYEPERPLASPAAAGLAWVAALRAGDPARLSTIFARRPEADALHEWAVLGREMARLHREVARGGHDFRDVALRCRSGSEEGDLPWDDAGRWEVLAQIQEEYRGRLADLGMDDGELARIRAVRSGALEARQDLWLVGIPEMPGVVRQSLLAVRERVRVLVHAPEDRAPDFDELGCVRPERWVEAEVPVREDRLSVLDTPRDQAEEVARRLAALDGTYAADEVVVGVPDGDVLPWLEERLTGAGIPVRDAGGIRIRDTAPYRLLAVVADFLEGERFEALAALVRHPDLVEWIAALPAHRPPLPPGDWLTALDEWYGRHLPARLTDELPGRRRDGGRRDGGKRIQDLVDLIRQDLLGPFRTGLRTRRLAEWTGPVLELLALVYGARDLEPDSLRDRRLMRALGMVAEAVGSFREVDGKLDVPCRASTAIRLFLDQTGGQAVPADPERAAVELLGWLELHLDDAPVALLTGVNEPMLPESVHGDAFLPDALRTRLGLVDNRTRYARDAYRLTAMIHSGQELHLVSGRRTGEGDPLRPSRLLFAAEPEVVARRVRRFYDPEGDSEAEGESESSREPEAEGGSGPARDPDPASEAPPSRFRLPPEPVIHLDPPPATLSVTDFRGLLEDPYPWALKKFRDCRVLDDAAREMDPLVFGSLAHHVLQLFGASPAARLADEGAVAGELDRLLDRVATDWFGPDARVAVRVQVEQLRARLRRFAHWQAGWVDEGWEVRGVELSTVKAGEPFDVDGTPVHIRARIDRVDHHPESGSWAVFDYKTSEKGDTPEKSHRKGPKKDEKRWIDLQLPLYRWLLPRMTGDDGVRLFPGLQEDRVEVGFIRIPGNLDDVGHAMAKWDEDDHAHAMETVREVVRRLRAEPFAWDPGLRGGYRDDRLNALLGEGQLGGDPDPDEDDT